MLPILLNRLEIRVEILDVVKFTNKSWTFFKYKWKDSGHIATLNYFLKKILREWLSS